MIAALYVSKSGPYFNHPEIDPWDEERDARKYKGPFSVIAHPPCQRWGRYWGGGPMLHGSNKQKKWATMTDVSLMLYGLFAPSEVYSNIQKLVMRSSFMDFQFLTRLVDGLNLIDMGDGLVA